MKFKAIRQFLENDKRVSRLVDMTIDELDPGDVVIKTQFAAVNYKDARGVMGVGKVIGRFPCVPGIEMAGVVVESASPDFKPGDVVTVQRALGHQSAQITLGVYAHLWPTAEDRTRSAAADLMAEVLGDSADSVRTGTP